MAKGLNIYIAASIVLVPHVAFASIVEKLRDKGFKIVDSDEVMRRIVLRVPRSLVKAFIDLVREYAQVVVFEIKAVRREIDESALRGNAYIVRYGDRRLFYFPCGDWGVWGETRRRGTLLRLCRRAMVADPAQLPSAICSLSEKDLGKLPELLRIAEDCFRNLL